MCVTHISVCWYVNIYMYYIYLYIYMCIYIYICVIHIPIYNIYILYNIHIIYTHIHVHVCTYAYRYIHTCIFQESKAPQRFELRSSGDLESSLEIEAKQFKESGLRWLSCC